MEALPWVEICLPMSPREVAIAAQLAWFDHLWEVVDDQVRELVTTGDEDELDWFIHRPGGANAGLQVRTGEIEDEASVTQRTYSLPAWAIFRQRLAGLPR